MTTNGNWLPVSYLRRFAKYFLAAWSQSMRLSSLLQGYQIWLPSADFDYASRASRQAICSER